MLVIQTIKISISNRPFIKSYLDCLHLEYYLLIKYHDPSLSGSLDILFTNNEKLEKGDNSVMDLQNFTKSKLGHIHLGHNL